MNARVAHAIRIQKQELKSNQKCCTFGIMALKTNSIVQSMKKKSKINSTKEATISKSNGNDSANKSKHIIFDDDDNNDGEVKVKIAASKKPNKADKGRKNAIEIGKQWYLRVCYYNMWQQIQ